MGGDRDMLFVYGTLMRGEPSAHLLGDDARFVRATRTSARYWLANVDDSYPALVEGGSDAVAGEIFEVSVAVLPALDAHEDVPELYRRVRVELGAHRPWVYVFRVELAGGYPRIESGDWRRR